MLNENEILTGKTSQITKTDIGFDSEGNIVNHNLSKKTIENTVKMSTKILTFIDMGGDAKYIKFVVPGFLSHYPDYAMILISAQQQELPPQYIQYLEYAIFLEIPILVVITFCDSYDPKPVQEKFEHFIQKRIKGTAILEIDSLDTALQAGENLQNIIPLIKISNTTNHNIPELKSLLNFLPLPYDVDADS